MILCGVGGIVLVEIYLAVMQREFAQSHNGVGKGFAVAGVYMFCILYGTSDSFQTLLWPIHEQPESSYAAGALPDTTKTLLFDRFIDTFWWRRRYAEQHHVALCC